MKAELYMHPTKGLCILVSELNMSHLSKAGNSFNPLISNPYPIATLIRENRKIEAIKELRGQTKWGLKEAKEYIDKYMPTTGPIRNYNAIEAGDLFFSDHMPSDFLEKDEFNI